MLVNGLMALALAMTPVQAAPAKVDCAKMKCLALTFDDGPGPYTTTLLKTLKKAKAKATFYLVGKSVEKRPEVAAQIVRAGHEVGNHTWSHPSLPTMPDEHVLGELSSTQDVIEQATGVRPRTFRPPYGHSDERVLLLAQELGLAQVKWTDTTLDWSLRDKDRIRNKVLKLARPGGVILMHDPVPATVKAMPEVLKELKKRGYHLVTVSTLLGKRKLAPGEAYPS
ncbi:polysaccharide deacetylase family protein [Nonomuraea sp. NPDC050663]|uniref:polysaccharide deacetylase family protein n=1 Tax=Nonomuraea sp. NPDC050663 TaxID=3364370 RepID=UPI0037A97D5F